MEQVLKFTTTNTVATGDLEPLVPDNNGEYFTAVQ
jgi:hypothetical protein